MSQKRPNLKLSVVALQLIIERVMPSVEKGTKQVIFQQKSTQQVIRGSVGTLQVTGFFHSPHIPVLFGECAPGGDPMESPVG